MLALVTTVHFGLAALRNHRQSVGARISSLAVVSFLLAGLPWLFPSVIGLAVGLGIHLVWFAICEALVPAPVRAGAAVQPSGAARSPARIPDAAAGAASTKPKRAAQAPFAPATVLAVVNETPGIRTIRLARPEGFDFVPGQFLTVRVRIDGHEHARCYSLSSAPEARGYLEISVRRQGLVSNALHTTVRPGSTLSIKGPVGAFKYPSDDDRSIVLVAGGIGITPLVSMLRHMVAAQPTRPVTLLYSARSEEDLAFRDELIAIARRHPQVRVHLAVSGGAGGPGLYAGRIDQSLLTATVPDLPHSICFVCGPAPMIESMKALLASMGVPPAQIRHEVFNAAIAASAESPRTAAPARSSVREAGYRMTCAKLRRQVRIAAGQTLLEAAEAANVPVESLCRAGVCGTCRVHVDSGDVICASDTLDPGDQEQGYVLACVTTASSDCTVDL